MNIIRSGSTSNYDNNSTGDGRNCQNAANDYESTKRIVRNLNSEFEDEVIARDEKLASFEKKLESLTQDFEAATRLGIDTQWVRNTQRRREPSPIAAQHTPSQNAGLHNLSPGHQGSSKSSQAGSSNGKPPGTLSHKQRMDQEEMRRLVQSNMANLNSCHHKLNTALVQQGYDVSSDNLEVELYDQRNVLASTDPELLDSNYETRMAMMNQINANLSLKLKKKKEKLALLTKKSSILSAVQSEPRRSERLKNKKKTNKDHMYLYY